MALIKVRLLIKDYVKFFRTIFTRQRKSYQYDNKEYEVKQWLEI